MVTSESFVEAKPEEFNVDVEWEDDGYMADAQYFMFDTPLSAEKIYSEIAHLLPTKYSPLNATVKGDNIQVKANQGYL